MSLICEPLPLLPEDVGVGPAGSPAAPPFVVTIASPEDEDEEQESGGWFDCRCPGRGGAVPLVLALGSDAVADVLSVPPMATAGADVGVPRSGTSNGLVGFALSSDRIGRNGRLPLLAVLDAAVLSAVSSERVFDSASCLSDALILSGFRGGGSGGSEAAAIVTVPAVPFSCIPTSRSREFTVSSLMAVSQSQALWRI